MSSMITGLFETPSSAAQAVRNLEARGIHPNQISLLANDQFAGETFGIEASSKAPEGAAAGGAAGAAIGALTAGLTAVGVIGTGGLGLVAAGPIVATLAGGGAGAAAGGILGGAIGAAIPEHEVKSYESALEEGSVMVGVSCQSDGDQKCAEDIFGACSAKSVATA